MSILSQLNDDLAAVADQVLASLVQVQNGGRSGGAGFVWAADRVVTNAHVVQQEVPDIIFPDGRTAPAEILLLDPDTDLALLRVATGETPPVSRGDSRRLRPGDWILAVGHPWGIRGAASAGSVIALGQSVEGVGRYRGELLQVALHLRPGHSGGPMVDAGGRLVGVNTMIAGPLVGLAVPVHVVEELVQNEAQESEFSL